jgi:quinoprotein glucose dehydrogenase
MRRALLILIGLIATAGLAAQSPNRSTDWPIHGRDTGAMRFSPLKQITTSNVSQLELVWTYDTPAPVPPLPSREGAPPVESSGESPARPAPRQGQATPLVVNGVMHMNTAYNRVVALDPETGKEIWVRNVGNMISTRGIAYWPGDGEIGARLVFGTADQAGLLIALDAKTGEFAGGFGQNGKVDFRKGLGGDKFPKLRAALSSPPAIYKNLAITGQHSQEAPSLGPTGDVRAWDMRTVSWYGRSTRCHGRVNRIMTSGATIGGPIAPAPISWGSSPSTSSAVSRMCRQGRRPPTSTAVTGSARISTARRSWRSTQQPES